MFGVSPAIEADHQTPENRDMLQITYLQSKKVSSKSVTMCCLINWDTVVTCSREPVIYAHDLIGLDEPLTKYQGHTMSVSAIEAHKTSLASGARDCCIKLWDVETTKCLFTHTKDRNLPTCIKWIDDSTFLQTSEDKSIRVFDTRQGL
jgi:WD40 repeat protein